MLGVGVRSGVFRDVQFKNHMGNSFNDYANLARRLTPMSPNLRMNTALIAMLLSFSLGSAHAQTLGTIIGAVTDDTGAVIPGVEVEITNEGQGTSSVVVTQGDGSYRLPGVQPGSYSIRIEVEGFRAHLVENLQVEVGSILTYDATLEVGAVTETVTVEATTPLVETSRGSLGAVVENKPLLSG